MTHSIPEEAPVCRGPLAFPQNPENDLADLPPCSPCADQNPDIFEFSGPWLCRPDGDPQDELAALPAIVPDFLPEETGADMIPDWPQTQSAGVSPGTLLASLGFHAALVLLMLGFALLGPPEVDFELAAGSTLLELDMVQIAKLGGGEELAPNEAPSPEQVAEKETPPPEPEPEISFDQLAQPEPAPEPEIIPLAAMDPKFKEAPAEKPKETAKKAAQKKPKQAMLKPPKGAGSPEVGGKAGAGPGQVLGSAHGHSALGGGGAGGKKNSGNPGWAVARRPEPRYPESSKQSGEQGEVVIMVTVLSSGIIGSASVAKSSGYSRLDQAALSAARGILFKVGKGGAPSGPVSVRVPYQFRLKK